MGNKWKIYKASGKVTFFVDDLMAKTKERALEIATTDIADDTSFAAEHCNIKILELKVEPLRPATKEEVIDGHGEEEWED